MTNEHEFAKEQAQLLFEMRIEDNRIVDNLECEDVPEKFINQIVDDPEHAEKIKALIEKRILEHILQYDCTDAAGNLIVTEDVYDCWFEADHYIHNLWEEQEEAARKARIKTKFKVWIEVERIETDDENNDEDYSDMACPVGVSHVDTLEEAVELQNQIVTTFGTIN